MPKMLSDLNLNADTPVRVQPGGVWGPARVPSPAQRKAVRRRVVGFFVSMTVALFALGYFFYRILMGG